jgi:hypothetical protein
MSFTKVEVIKPNLPKKVSIKTFFDPELENMGLQNYGMTLHEGVFHTEALACIENNGVKRYVTGLNEYAPEVKKMEGEEKEAKIKEIRSIVSQLERELAANSIDPEDPDFWNKVELLRPNNSEFWDKIELSAGNDSTFLDPHTNPYDLIKIYAIKAGGFSIVAPSYEAATKMAQPPKFYLDYFEETVSTKNESRKIRNKALSELQKMFDKNSNKLFYVTKVIDPGSPQYIKSTPNDLLYETMDDYINGNSFERSSQVASENFLSVCNEKVGDLKSRAIVKDAAYHKVIVNKSDGRLYHAATQTALGKNISEVVGFLNNPVNDDVLAAIQDSIESEWNK